MHAMQCCSCVLEEALSLSVNSTWAWLGCLFRRQHRHRMAAQAGDPHAGGAQRKRQRAAIFAQWLLDTYGSDALNQGSGTSASCGTRPLWH